MPEISRFYGIIIAMYFNDHPPPHFHARYGRSKAKVLIDPPTISEGDLPPRASRLVIEWASQHREELNENFAAVMAHRATTKIEPLQ